MERVRKKLDTSLGIIKADVVLKGGFILDVFTQSVYKRDIAIVDDEIVGIGDYEGEEEINCEGLYITPAFIDSHVHIESSKVIPEIFAGELIKKGVMTCIADPHEIANVLGEEGIEFMIENGRKSVIDIFYMIPSCVPAVEFEDNGAILKGENLERFKSYPDVLGLGEVMDVNAVIRFNDDMNRKLTVFNDKTIDGHCPKIDERSLNGYVLSGIKTDHECSTPEEAVEKIKRGMYVMIREGSAAKNLEQLLPAINEGNFHRFLFCTDDKSITDIIKEGSIDNNIRKAVKLGLDPVKAVTIAALNAAQCYNIKGKGAIAPGYKADLVILENLEDVVIKEVIRKGKLYKIDINLKCPNPKSSMNIDHINEEMLKLRGKSGKVNVIKVVKGSIVTDKVQRDVIVNNGVIDGIVSDDALKIAVFERHKKTGRFAVGYIEGLGIKNCSIAQTIAHDSHNIIAIGDNDKDIVEAVNRVIDIKGGIVAVSSGKILEEISLPIGGLMACIEPESIMKKFGRIYDEVKKYCIYDDMDIFITLSFMALPVIPEIKITSRGLYDYNKGRFIDLYCSED